MRDHNRPWQSRLIPVVVGVSLFHLVLAGGHLVGAEDKLLMQAVGDLPPGAPAGQVIGADPADPKLWPATFVFRNAEGGGCTATAVGRQAILTAAHCIEDGAKGSIAVKGFTSEVVCRHHPSYPAETSADFALCTVAKPLPKLGDGYEVVNATSALPAAGQDVTLLGYGCIQKGGVDKTFGVLYGGRATVHTPATTNLYIVTKGGAAVCFGDSGGGAYYTVNPGGSIRRLFGVNSRGDISKYSLLSTTANMTFRDWATKWASAANLRICGLDERAEDCRQ